MASFMTPATRNECPPDENIMHQPVMRWLCKSEISIQRLRVDLASILFCLIGRCEGEREDREKDIDR